MGTDTGVRAARHYQTQSAATGIESLWRFIQMAGGPRTRQVRTLTGHLNFHFKMALFIWTKSVGMGFGIQGKVRWITNKQVRHSHPGRGHLTWSTGAQAPPGTACGPPEAHRWGCLWSPGVRAGPTFSSWHKAFTGIDY